MLAITWAFQENLYKHIDVEESGRREGQLGIGFPLVCVCVCACMCACVCACVSVVLEQVPNLKTLQYWTGIWGLFKEICVCVRERECVCVW